MIDKRNKEIREEKKNYKQGKEKSANVSNTKSVTDGPEVGRIIVVGVRERPVTKMLGRRRRKIFICIR